MKATPKPYTSEIIAEVRKIGLTGIIWDDVAPKLGRGRDALQKIWTTFASPEEKAIRRELRRKAIYEAQIVTQQKKQQAKIAARRLVKMPDSVRFEDDPIAVADCDPFPTYRASMFGVSAPRSLSPSTAGR